ncbi:polyprenol monophosphomannose synthase [Agrococcus sp. ARC_14]|uniref:polyprenol monophosphomannose synthase n=1 Tax=Agrococcus sp. ARC_14 TaxID=2919927 RepID=UPI001F06F51F|nr:polyprenol monophosphomannose synthase [Agrococcus sp. ARC_14]MCH1882340.1 polyprenol monophosphomannose synthase [Agrococcus sp. ARC_14]
MRVVVLVPTYNELEALPVTMDHLLQAAPEVEVLVVDDSSPDGTGELADRMAAADPRVDVLHRSAKEGLGAAYLHGMRVALERGADVVVEFDADGSHPAEAVPRMLAALRRADGSGADLVIGSRWVPGGGIVDWPWHRQAISRLGNLYARVLLGSPVQDMTAGCRAYTAELLRRIPLDQVRSQGYCFQIDMTRRAHEVGATVAEVPILFRERELGSSKMTPGIVREALTSVTGWAVGRALRATRDLTRRSVL